MVQYCALSLLRKQNTSLQRLSEPTVESTALASSANLSFMLCLMLPPSVETFQLQDFTSAYFSGTSSEVALKKSTAQKLKS